MGAILFGMGYISLLDDNYISKRQINRDFGKWGFVCAMVWTSVLFIKGDISLIFLITGALFFLIDAIRISIRFFRTYYKAVHEMENYSSENTEAFILWLYNSTFGIVFFGLIGAGMAFAPKWAVGIYMSAGICMFVYIFISLLNYSVNCEKVNEIMHESSIKEELRTNTSISYDTFDKRLEEWISQGIYKEQGITIEHLIDLFGSNRNVVSEYFNRRLNTSFREWINDLRLSDAKLMLLEDINFTIEEVALRTGFSGKSYFSTVFKKRENMTPTEWRKLESQRMD